MKNEIDKGNTLPPQFNNNAGKEKTPLQLLKKDVFHTCDIIAFNALSNFHVDKVKAELWQKIETFINDTCTCKAPVK